MQLFCFTFAGGTGEFFYQLAQELKEDIEVIPLEYAGHGRRHKDKFYDSFVELADDMFNMILELYHEGEEFGLFGYSMGCISVVEVMKKIQRSSEIPMPKHLFLAAHEPNSDKSLTEIKFYDDELIKMRTINFGGIPLNLVNNSSFWRRYLPIYKSDYMLIGNYDFKKLDFKCDVPMTIFYSEEDTPLKSMRNWKEYFLGQVDFLRYNGNHFFLRNFYAEISEIISRKMMEKQEK